MKPFLSNRNQLAAHTLQPLADASAADAVARATAHKHGKDGTGPSVEAIKEGDKVVRIVVTCSCGERIEIDCLYPAGG